MRDWGVETLKVTFDVTTKETVAVARAPLPAVAVSVTAELPRVVGAPVSAPVVRLRLIPAGSPVPVNVSVVPVEFATDG